MKLLDYLFKKKFKVRLKRGLSYYHPQYSYGIFEDWKYFSKHRSGNRELCNLCGSFGKMRKFLLEMKSYDDVLKYEQSQKDSLNSYLEKVKITEGKLPFDIVD